MKRSRRGDIGLLTSGQYRSDRDNAPNNAWALNRFDDLIDDSSLLAMTPTSSSSTPSVASSAEMREDGEQGEEPGPTSAAPAAPTSPAARTTTTNNLFGPFSPGRQVRNSDREDLTRDSRRGRELLKEIGRLKKELDRVSYYLKAALLLMLLR